jgi:hypothetical protein
VVLSGVFHAWERRLAAIATDRVVRPFEWGLDWVDGAGGTSAPGTHLEQWADQMVASSEQFFALAPCTDFTLDGEWVSYPSAVRTPHSANNTVHARYFPDSSPAGRKRAVIVLPQWNADPEGHVGLCRLLNRFKISALRLSLPYHDKRRPPELRRADYIVSSNVGRTAQVCRQAVLDARRGIEWLASQGYESIGILGTSLGSCLAMLTAAHEPRLEAVALNHISPYFADVVWSGLSTHHVRQGLDGHIDLTRLRRIWMPISPYPYLDRMRDKRLLLVYARYDLTFPVDLSRVLVREFSKRGLPHEVVALPCGHYSTGVAPFNFLDAFVLTRFLRKQL